MSYSIDEFITQQNKKRGQNTIQLGHVFKMRPARIPFGIFPLDYITGGGIPLHGSTCLWGPKGGSKTTLAKKLVRSCQILCWRCFKPIGCCLCEEDPLRMKAVWCDAEGTFDMSWAGAIGINMDELVYVLADTGEQYIDIAEAALRSDDCGLVIIDSLASMIPESEFDNPSDKGAMADQARMIARGVRKWKQRLIRERKRGHNCAIVLINQFRTNLGIMFGSKDSMPGGNALEHEFSLLLRCVKKSLSKEKDKKFIASDDSIGKDKASRHAVSIRKEKIFTIASACEFVIIKESIDQFLKGDVDDLNILIKYARHNELILSPAESGDSQWILKASNQAVSKFDRASDLKTFLERDADARFRLGENIINKVTEEKIGR